MRSRAMVLAMLMGQLMQGCQTVPTGVEAAADDPGVTLAHVPGGAYGEFELRQRDRAQVLARQGRLAEAALAWETLAVLRADVVEYRDQLARVRRQIDIAVADRWQRADQAFRRGDADQATQGYLAVLALQPDHIQAAEALRSLERERNKRTYLGKPSRITLAQRPSGAKRPAPGEVASGTAPLEQAELEHAVMLASQGEYDEAISVLERRLAIARNDEAARALLADAYFQKAEGIAARDPGAAITTLEKCLKLDAAHPQAAERLRQLRAGAADRGGAIGAPPGALQASPLNRSTQSLEAPTVR